MDHLTPTAIELMNSAAFWNKRTDEQVAYALAYGITKHTRPDHLEVLASAHEIQDRCEMNYLNLRPKNDPF